MSNKPTPRASSKKCIQALGTDDAALSASTVFEYEFHPATSYELSNADCKKGHVTQRPPIPYAVSKNGLLVSTLQETVKIKTPKGESKQSLLGGGADREEYVKYLMSFSRFMEKKGYKADLEAASKVTLSPTTALKKLAKAQTGEKDPANAERLTKLEAVKVRLINAKVTESTLACLAYDLFCKLLRVEPKIQWDWIVTDMYTKKSLGGY